ncbi:M3 family metallopeptidase, partial [Lachnospiraceae bacterium OttesenSCG-928-E19]|nr:M3 family metallopeptidase [Lachnospiraceae bacterium OttesenSCG-928-E19]
IAIILAIFTLHKKEETMLGKFNLNALENAEQNVNDAIATSRAAVEELVKIENKTYMNFVRPMMDLDVILESIISPISHLDSVNNSDRTKEIMNNILPVLSEYSTDMSQHKGIYNAFKEIRANEYDSLNDAQKKLVDDAIRGFEISGINLPANKQARIKEIGVELSKLSNDFSNNVIEANKSFKIKITDEKLLGKMSESDRAAARVADGWEFSLLDPLYGPFMTFVTDRDLRKQMHTARFARAPQNMDIIVRMLELRTEMADILGYKNYAELVFEDRSAPSVDTAKDFLKNILEHASNLTTRERNELIERARADGITDFAPWDAAYYGRGVQKDLYSLDESAAREYFELNATVNGMFDVLSEIFEIKFTERSVPLWHRDAKYYDVSRDGKIFAGFYIDLTTRESKSPGAWMNSFQDHYLDSKNERHLTEVINVGNFPTATDNTPSLLSPKDVSTMFHEMGHGLHGLLTRVDEKDMSGTNVDRDVVEFPSMFLEYFWNSPIVLKRIAKHYKTGETISDEMIGQIIKSDQFMRGTHLNWLGGYSLFDLEIHTRKNMTANDIKKLFDTLVPSDMITPGIEYDRPLTAFLHPFGHGYAAGYYSYLWAEQLASDAYIAADGNPFNFELMRKYRDTVLALGGTKKMNEIYIDFMGRDPNPDSLLKFYGLIK